MKRLRWRQPAARWEDSLPLGNGTLGACVYGNLGEETVLVNHEALFDDGGRDSLPNVSRSLTRLRKLLNEGKYAEAERFYAAQLERRGYRPRVGRYLPALDLRLLGGTAGGFFDYCRELDLEQGLARVSFREHGEAQEREFFVDENALCFRIAGRPFDMTLALVPHAAADGEEILAEVETEAFGDHVYFRVRTAANLSYGAVLRIWTDGVATCFNREGPDGFDELGAPDYAHALKVCGAGELVGTLKVFPERTCRGFALADLPDCCDYAARRAAHVRRFAERFSRVRLELSDRDENTAGENEAKKAADEDAGAVEVAALFAQAERGRIAPGTLAVLAAFGRYLLISSGADGTLPVNLQGIWNGDYRPAWNAAFFFNENIEMSYWQSLPGGLPETLLPLFDYCDAHRRDFAENARRLYGCRGYLLPLYADADNALLRDLQPHVLYWTGGGAWIASFYYDYWRYTGDETFLRERALPFLREVAVFYEDFARADEEGILHFLPADSPENRSRGTFAGAGTLNVSIDPTMEVALCREVWLHLADGEQALGRAADAARWRELAARLPDYRINAEGSLCEWLYPDFQDRYEHRHLSHLYPLFPGRELLAAETDPALLSACRRAAELRLKHGLRAQTGWSLVHLACVFARLGDAERAGFCLDRVFRCCTGPNLFTYHNDWRRMGATMNCGPKAPFQIDANLGLPTAVYEMLVRCGEDRIVLFPALPADWRSGLLDGLRLPGGGVLQMQWSERSATISLCGKTPRTLFVCTSLPVDSWVCDGDCRRAPEGWTVSLRPDVPLRLTLRRSGARADAAAEAINFS